MQYTYPSGNGLYLNINHFYINYIKYKLYLNINQCLLDWVPNLSNSSSFDSSLLSDMESQLYESSAHSLLFCVFLFPEIQSKF